MAKIRSALLMILLTFISINGIMVFAITDSFSILPDKQKTFDIILHENEKIFFKFLLAEEKMATYV